MRICLIADLHIPNNAEAIQNKVLSWAIADAVKKNADLLVFAGDMTADGSRAAIERFQKAIHSISIPAMVIPGNSDFRSPETTELVRQLASVPVMERNGYRVIALMDGERTIPDAIYNLLDGADAKTIVCGHHPPEDLQNPHRAKMMMWRETHPDVPFFFGHLHKSENRDGYTHALPAADPDKAIGESPAISYYDTETGILEKAYFYCPVPYDLHEYIGVSCMHPLEDIPYVITHQVRHIELRMDAASIPRAELLQLLHQWRAAGGQTLSLHAPEIFENDRKTYAVRQWELLAEFADCIQVDRITLHAPNIPMGEVSDGYLDEISEYVVRALSKLPETLTIGIENMHMTQGEQPDNRRRFGYLPEECLRFVRILKKHTSQKVGIHLDVGHARNNAPYSQTHTLSAWYAGTGSEAVGYHIHQVLQTDQGMENHMPIDCWYGRLISYASFFREWNDGTLAKAPVFLEIRQEKGYAVTIELLEQEERRRVFDLHSHTYYSFCGRDNPQTMVDTVVANGVRLLGITDHNSGIGSRKAEYEREIRRLAEKNRNRIRILCGIEITTLPKLYDITDPSEIANYDYCLLEHIDMPESIAYGRLFEFSKQLGIPCGIAHTDLFAYCDKLGYPYLEFFRKMAAAGIFWEMNVSYDSIHQYREHAYVADFVTDKQKQKIVREAGVLISVGFDGHRCEDYDGARVARMVDFLRNAGIRTADELFPES